MFSDFQINLYELGIGVNSPWFVKNSHIHGKLVNDNVFFYFKIYNEVFKFSFKNSRNITVYLNIGLDITIPELQGILYLTLVCFEKTECNIVSRYFS